MNTKLRFLFLTILLAVVSCKQTPKTAHATETENAHHWSYSGETSPEHWIEIEKNSDCDGKHQSPINIINKDADSVKIKGDLKIQYTPTTLLSEVENNGHSIQFDFEAT